MSKCTKKAQPAAAKPAPAAPVKKCVTLKFTGKPGDKVVLAGTFNEWAEKPMTDKKGDGVFSCQLRLVPGEYQYKFKVNDVWHSDETNPKFVPNQFGTLNSVLVVEEK